MSPNFAVTDLLSLKSASLEVVPFTKLGADLIPEELNHTLLAELWWPWPATLLAGLSPSFFAGKHSQDLTGVLEKCFLSVPVFTHLIDLLIS